MLVSESRFKSMTGKDIADATHQAEGVMQLRVESRERVDELVVKALAAGGLPLHETNDQGFLYGRSFQDLDRHSWDAFHVDETAMPSKSRTADPSVRAAAASEVDRIDESAGAGSW
jgi:predicted lactoylglutathione lyase